MLCSRYEILSFDQAKKVLEADGELDATMLAAVSRGLGLQFTPGAITPHSTRDGKTTWRGLAVLGYIQSVMSQRG